MSHAGPVGGRRAATVATAATAGSNDSADDCRHEHTSYNDPNQAGVLGHPGWEDTGAALACRILGACGGFRLQRLDGLARASGGIWKLLFDDEC